MFESLLSDRGLSLDRLKNFCAIASAGGISRAAAGDPAKQSLYSRQIRELEEFFQTELTRRKGKGIELTEAGQELARAARAQLQGLMDFKDVCTSQPLEYRIGGGNSVLEWLIIPNLAVITAAAPEAQFNLLHMRTSAVIRALLDHTLDFGIVRKTVLVPGLDFHEIGKIEYSLYIPKGWIKLPFHPRKTFFTDYPYAVSLGGEFLEKFTEAFEKRRLKPQIRFKCATFTHVAHLVQTGQAMAVLPQAARVRDAIERPFPWLGEYSREMVVAWHKRLTSIRPKAEGVLEQFRKIVKSS